MHQDVILTGMGKAIRDLKQDTKITILPADEGNATIVMDRYEYVTKMNALLKDNTYHQLRKDPTHRVETKVSKALRALEDNNCLSDKERKYLSPNCSKPPQIYGLPKVHKKKYPPQAHCINYRIAHLPAGKGAYQNPDTTGRWNRDPGEEFNRVCSTNQGN